MQTNNHQARRTPIHDRPLTLAVGVLLGGLAVTTLVEAHEAALPAATSKLIVKTGKSGRRAILKLDAGGALSVDAHDPSTDGTSLVIRATGPEAGGTGLIALDRTRWKRTEKKGQLTGYRYRDKKGTRGGVTKAILKDGTLTVKAKGKRWPWEPAGGHDDIQIEFRIGGELFCSGVPGAKAKRNRKNLVKAIGMARPGSCAEQVCGNGQLEIDEECDDGNLQQRDGCTTACLVGECDAPSFNSTYEAIQTQIFSSSVYGCTNAVCHDSEAPAGGLDLTPGNSYAALINQPGSVGGFARVVPTDPGTSLLYLKLAAKTFGAPANVGTPMPQNLPALSEEQLDALYKWIRGGAPEDLVVEGTQAALATCLPDPDPLKVDPPDPPPPGVGFQLASTPRPLPRSSESEVCYSTYYDLSAVVPDSAVIDCPPRFQFEAYCSQDENQSCREDGDCGAGNTCIATRNVFNPESKCIAFHRTTLVQDPQSHHAVQFIYSGAHGLEHPAWGAWTYRFEGDDPRNGTECDPVAVDPATGSNPGCSSSIVSDVACISYGPPDFGGIDNFVNPQLQLAQEAYFDYEFDDGVYDVFPIRGLFTWNSHAFNLTSKDSTLAAYMNFEYAQSSDQLNPVQSVFEVTSIFAQDVPPFETREYCRTYTAPEGARLFRLGSHTHRHGTLFRVWSPPNTPCRAGCPDRPDEICFETAIAQIIFGEDPRPVCSGPREDDPLYRSTLYSDPLELYFDPAIVHTGSVEERTYLFCAVYDNGATAESPAIKRQSTSPLPPGGLFGITLGGPCEDDEVACIGGPRHGQLCNGSDAFCDSEPDAGDGDCDACPVRGGLTTEDEMFILLGGYY